MNRETQAHFAQIPSMDISRSKFDRSFIHKTTCNVGELVPIYCDPDIIPGDTVTMKMSDLIRMTTPITPVMDELKADFYFFFVPNRLVWTNFKKFMGENDTAPWIQTTTYQIPQIYISNSSDDGSGNLINTVLKGSVLDHMGLPTNYSWVKAGTGSPAEPSRRISVSALPARGYALIWNEFFRSESLDNPVTVNKQDAAQTIVNANNSGYISNPDSYQVSNAYKGGLPCLKACKTFDYFTACLPAPQAGPDVTLPMNGIAPIKFGEYYTYDSGTGIGTWTKDNTITDKMALFQQHTTSGSPSVADNVYLSYITSNGSIDLDRFNREYSLTADLSQATGATINQLRTAFAIQKWQEREARGGQRYTEMVRSHFNVINPDFRLQRPEYLGGFTHQISVNQVIQSVDSGSDPLGTTGAYSLTTHKDGDVFSHSFSEHGCLIGLMVIRQNQHTYQQGINRAWLKKDRFDFYTPEFANLGETYVQQQELYATGITSNDTSAFGYQERWAEMRYMPDIVTGEMRSDYPQSLDIWHYADYYTSAPSLGNKWIHESDANFLRTLAVQNQDQFKVDLYFGAIYTRPLPVFSVPGLLDHH